MHELIQPILPEKVFKIECRPTTKPRLGGDQDYRETHMTTNLKTLCDLLGH